MKKYVGISLLTYRMHACTACNVNNMVKNTNRKCFAWASVNFAYLYVNKNAFHNCMYHALKGQGHKI